MTAWWPFLPKEDKDPEPDPLDTPVQKVKRRPKKKRRTQMASSSGTATRSKTPSPEEREMFAAKAEEARAAAALANAEKRVQVAEAAQQEIVLRAKQRVEKDELAKNAHHQVYVYDKAVDESSVKACISQLTTWSRQTPGCDIEIQINSPGGDIVEGFALIDFIEDLRRKDHKVDIVAFGMAASMAGVILQAADTRIMGKNALLLIHEASFGASGSFGKIEDRVKLVKIMQDRILDIFASRANSINKKTTKRYIERNWARKDWWMDAKTALELGFVDEVR